MSPANVKKLADEYGVKALTYEEAKKARWSFTENQCESFVEHLVEITRRDYEKLNLGIPGRMANYVVLDANPEQLFEAFLKVKKDFIKDEA